MIYSTKLTIVDSVKRAVFGMIKCECKHTIKLYDIYQNPAADAFYMVMELCEGNLEHLMKKLGRPFNTLEVKEILNQLNEVFYKDAQIVILVYDSTSRQTFDEIKNYWYKQVKDNSPPDISKKIFI